MKKAVIILSILLSCTILLLGWNVFSEVWYNHLLEEAVDNIGMPGEGVYASFGSIEELKKGWPTIPIEEHEDISPEHALQIGIKYLEQEFNISIYEKLFKTKYIVGQSKDGKYYIITMLINDFTDVDVAIDKKTGGALHVWLGE